MIRIKARAGKLEFGVDSGGILKRTVEFGSIEDEDEDDDGGVEYDQVFQNEQFLKITKIFNLSNYIHVYTTPGLPINISSRVGDLGKISVFVKNREQSLADQR